MEDVIIRKTKEIRVVSKFIIYFALGVLWSFSQVGYSFSFLPWFTFVPFLFLIKYEDLRSGFLYVSVFGFAVYFFHFWWMPTPVALSIDFLPGFLSFINWIIGWFLTILMSYYHGLMYVLVFIIAKIVTKKNPEFFYFIVPLTVTVLDYFFPKLWHDQIGYSQYLFFYFSQVVDLFGVPFITFLIISCNAAAVNFIEAYMFRKNMRAHGVMFSLVIIMIVLSSVYGIFRYDHIMDIAESSKKAKIGVVQANFSGLDKKDRNKFSIMKDVFNKMSVELLDENPDLIVWPETAMPHLFDSKATRYNSIKRFRTVPLFAGVHIFNFNKEKNKGYLYNSGVLVDANGNKIDSYNKMKLVPFVERFPVSFLNILLNMAGYQEFSAGEDSKILEIGPIRFLPNICYEAIIPDFIRRGIKQENKEANLIINLTNDSWYGNTIEPKMHLQMTGFRAIENRKSLIRSTCTGYSAIFDPAGDIIYKSPLFKKDSVVKTVPLMEMRTIYNIFGWLFIYILGIILIILIFIAIFRIIRFRHIKSKMIQEAIHKRDLLRIWTE